MRKRPLTSRGVQRMREREQSAGLDPGDEAARWIAENDPAAPPVAPKSERKSKALHRWRRQHPRNQG